MYASNLFKEQVVLITGGRSGIGFGIAKRFMELGAAVFICSRKEPLLQEAAAELSKFGTVHYKTCDIRKPDEIRAMADAIQAAYGRLDILINNAGGQFPMLAEYISDNGWKAVIDTNLNGTFYVSRIMAERFFIPQKSGNIVNIIVDIYKGFPGMSHTGAARAGVENLTKSLAQEWSRFNIRVNAIAPGTIVSSGLDTYEGPIKLLADKIKDQNLLGRLGTIDDVANAVLFFASPLSSYTSASTLYVDGMDHLNSNKMDLVRSVIGD